uniref:Putative secreted peptide n=1 Tax=Anopheles braziliensis TaxID=58242 RepID=A0A2M3ZUC1_9DIPT
MFPFSIRLCCSIVVATLALVEMKPTRTAGFYVKTICNLYFAQNGSIWFSVHNPLGRFKNPASLLCLKCTLL